MSKNANTLEHESLVPAKERPTNEAVFAAAEQVDKVFDYVPVLGVWMLATLVLRAAIHDGNISVLAAQWAIYEAIKSGKLEASYIRDVPGDEGILSEHEPPAGMGVAEGLLFCDRDLSSSWGIMCLCVPQGSINSLGRPFEESSRKNRGGRKPNYKPETARKCFELLDEARNKISRRIKDVQFGSELASRIDEVPEEITKQLNDLTNIDVQQLGELVKKAAQSPRN